MARVLDIYFNFTPNQDNNTHYCFSDQLAYISHLFYNVTSISVNLDNYRINTGVVKIKKSAVSEEIRNATYVVEMEKPTGQSFLTWQIIRCWHVKSYEELDYYVLHVEVDLWGTYFKYASLSNINVLRCNRNIGHGIYDEVRNTDIDVISTTKQKPYTSNGWLTDNGEWAFEEYVNVVFAVEYNIEQQVFGSDHISTTGMFAISIKDLRAKAHSDYAGLAGVLYAMDMIGGIFGVNASWGSPLDARILKAWILPNPCITKSNKTLTFKSKSIYAKNAQIDIVAYQVEPTRKSLQYRNIDYTLGKATYFGTYNNGLKLKPYTDAKLHVFASFQVGVSDLSVVIMQGESQKDITNAFELQLTTNVGETTTLRYIAKSFNTAFGASKSAFGDTAKGGALGGPVFAGIAGVGSVVNSALGMINQQPVIDSAIGGGDGATNYYGYHEETISGSTWYCVRNPFMSFVFDSVEDESAKARLYGASFNVVVSDLSTLDNNTLLGTGTFDDTYIVANMRVDGVPKDAKTYIENAFKNGIYMKYLH